MLCSCSSVHGVSGVSGASPHSASRRWLATPSDTSQMTSPGVGVTSSRGEGGGGGVATTERGARRSASCRVCAERDGRMAGAAAGAREEPPSCCRPESRRPTSQERACSREISSAFPERSSSHSWRERRRVTYRERDGATGVEERHDQTV